MTAAELRALAPRVGGVRELVGPTKRAQVASLSDDELFERLAAAPRLLRRPIIDTGGKVTLGFTPAVRAALADLE